MKILLLNDVASPIGGAESAAMSPSTLRPRCCEPPPTLRRFI